MPIADKLYINTDILSIATSNACMEILALGQRANSFPTDNVKYRERGGMTKAGTLLWFSIKDMIYGQEKENDSGWS